MVKVRDRLHSVSLRLTQRLAIGGLALENQDAASSMSDADRVKLWTADDRLSTLGMLVNAHSMRTEMLMCVGRPAKAAEVPQQMVEWLKALPSDAELLALTTTPKGPLTTDQRGRFAERASKLLKWISGVQIAVEQQGVIQTGLAQDGVDTLEHVYTVRNAPAAELLCYSHGAG